MHAGQAVLGHGEDHVAGAVVCQSEHGRAGGQHGAGLGLHGGDDACSRRQQRGVGSLVDLHPGLCARLLQLRALGLQRGLAAFDLQAADEALVAQFAVTPQFGGRQFV